jgi:lipoprotein-anchoring transpeptidase ErfK/SrfK
MTKVTRRDFLKLSAAGMGAILLNKVEISKANLPDVLPSHRLGRVLGRAEVKSKPDQNSQTTETKYDDDIVVCDREIIGGDVPRYPTSRLWYETPAGYIPAISVQPVKMEPNEPLAEIPTYGSKPGMWAEVTVPYVDIALENPPGRSPKLLEMTKPRFYYSQVLWVDGVRQDSKGETQYHVIEKHGSYGDLFWADARGFRPIYPEDISTINPDIEDKSIIVDVSHQTISCYEGANEILFSRASTGAKFDIYGNSTEAYLTPVGDYFAFNRKYISLHMGGGNAAAPYELFAVSWVSIFATGGVAIHSTYWHNNYGVALSHGCVNVPPDVAKFIFRWSQPPVQYDQGVIEIAGYSGTKVMVREY